MLNISYFWKRCDNYTNIAVTANDLGKKKKCLLYLNPFPEKVKGRETHREKGKKTDRKREKKRERNGMRLLSVCFSSVPHKLLTRGLPVIKLNDWHNEAGLKLAGSLAIRWN